MKRERSVEEAEKLPVLIVGLDVESYACFKAGTLTPLEFKVLEPLAMWLPRMRLDAVTRNPESDVSRVLRKIYHYRTEPGENEICEFTSEPTTEGDFCDLEPEEVFKIARHALVWFLYE